MCKGLQTLICPPPPPPHLTHPLITHTVSCLRGLCVSSRPTRYFYLSELCLDVVIMGHPWWGFWVWTVCVCGVSSLILWLSLCRQRWRVREDLLLRCFRHKSLEGKYWFLPSSYELETICIYLLDARFDLVLVWLCAKYLLVSLSVSTCVDGCQMFVVRIRFLSCSSLFVLSNIKLLVVFTWKATLYVDSLATTGNNKNSLNISSRGVTIHSLTKAFRYMPFISTQTCIQQMQCCFFKHFHTVFEKNQRLEFCIFHRRLLKCSTETTTQ